MSLRLFDRGNGIRFVKREHAKAVTFNAAGFSPGFVSVTQISVPPHTSRRLYESRQVIDGLF